MKVHYYQETDSLYIDLSFLTFLPPGRILKTSPSLRTVAPPPVALHPLPEPCGALISSDSFLPQFPVRGSSELTIRRYKPAQKQPCPSGYEPVVVGMAADPEPQYAIVNFHAERSVRQPNADGSETANLLEVERGVVRIALQQSEILIGKLLDRLG